MIVIRNHCDDRLDTRWLPSITAALKNFYRLIGLLFSCIDNDFDAAGHGVISRF